MKYARRGMDSGFAGWVSRERIAGIAGEMRAEGGRDRTVPIRMSYRLLGHLFPCFLEGSVGACLLWVGGIVFCRGQTGIILGVYVGVDSSYSCGRRRMGSRPEMM